MKDHHHHHYLWITATCAYLTSVGAFLGQTGYHHHFSLPPASIHLLSSSASSRLQHEAATTPTFVLYAQKKTPKPPTSPPPQSSVEGRSSSSSSYNASPFFANVVNEVVAPLFGKEIEKGVSGEIIKGASIAGASLGLVAGTGPIGAAMLGAGAAYTAISPGKGGQAARFVGEVSWDATNSAVKLYNDFDTSTKITGATQAFIVASLQVMSKEKPEDVNAMKAFLEAFKAQQNELEAGVEEAIREAEIALEEAEQLQQKQMAKDKAKIQKQIERKAEQVRMSVKVMRAEQAQIAEERRIKTADVQEKIELKAAEVREMTGAMRIKAAASHMAEVQEQIELKAAAVRVMTEAMRAQIAAVEEQASIEAEAIAAEQERIAREKEVARIEEQKRLEEEAYYAKVAAEARAAVEQQERERDAIAALKAIESELSPEEQELWDASEELAELLDTNADEIVDLEEEPVNGSAAKHQDWSAMTVVQLKDELRNRGLKVSGRKAELIERLMESS